MHVLKSDIISTSTEIYNTLFRKLLTRYSQIFEEERSFSKFHTSINSSRETNFKSLLSLRREKFFDFFTLLPASEELLSGENLSFLSNLPFIPALFPPPRPPLIFRACRVNRLLTKFFSSRKKVLVSPPASEEEKVLPLRPPKLPWQRAENFRKNELSIGEPDKIAWRFTVVWLSTKQFHRSDYSVGVNATGCVSVWRDVTGEHKRSPLPLD